MDSPPFLTLRPWMRARFGGPVHRVALDAGSTCPNRDGTKGFGGCTYCDVEGSGTGALKSGQDLGRQLDEGLARVASRVKPGEPPVAAVAYLQSYTNTYVEGGRFDEVLSVIEARLESPGPVPIVVVSVATRPDCLPDEVLKSLERLNRRVPVWVELGLESADDRVLTAINRLHTLAEFDEAARRLGEAGLLGVGHAILGLPGDGREGARRTAEALARSGLSGIKVHHLMVLERTQLAHQWRQGEVDPLAVETYVEWLADFVERLHPEQVLHRMTGEAPGSVLLAPLWEADKNKVRHLLIRELEQRGTRQGSHFLRQG